MGWALYTDKSGVCEVPGATHPTEEAALEVLVLSIESDLSDSREKLKTAKGRLRRVRFNQSKGST